MKVNGQWSMVNGLFVMAILLLSISALAVEPPDKAPSMLDNIVNVRVKQENEENVMRLVQPVMIQQETVCSPVQQTRDRLDNIGDSDNNFGNVTVEAGHGTVTVDNNSGTVDSSVNVQVVNNNGQDCL